LGELVCPRSDGGTRCRRVTRARGLSDGKPRRFSRYLVDRILRPQHNPQLDQPTHDEHEQAEDKRKLDHRLTGGMAATMKRPVMRSSH
jgi:hypothetical protein